MSEPSLDEAIASLEDYLRKYPSGNFSELAQGKLNALLAERGEKKIAIVSNAANPYSKGAAEVDSQYRVGDSYEFREVDPYTGSETSRSVDVVTSVTPVDVVYGDGKYVTDFLGNYRTRIDRSVMDYPVEFSNEQRFVAEYWIGKKWHTRNSFKLDFNKNGMERGDITLDFAVVARERVVIPAGIFTAFRVEGEGYMLGTRTQVKYWVAPDLVRRVLRLESLRYGRGPYAPRRGRTELLSFSEAIPPGS